MFKGERLSSSRPPPRVENQVFVFMTSRDKAAQLHSQALSNQQPGTSVESLPVLTMIVRVLLLTRCCTDVGVPFRRLNAGQSEQQLGDYTGKLPKSNEFRKEVRSSYVKRQNLSISNSSPENHQAKDVEFVTLPSKSEHFWL